MQCSVKYKRQCSRNLCATNLLSLETFIVGTMAHFTLILYIKWVNMDIFISLFIYLINTQTP